MDEHVHVWEPVSLDLVEPEVQQQAMYAVAPSMGAMWYEQQECSCGEKRSVPLS